MTQSQGLCVFCDRPGLSHQHILPKRLRTLIGDPNGVYPELSLVPTYSADGIEDVETELEISQGNIASASIRNVCKMHCNEGWMKEIEDRAAFVFAPLIQGHSFTLDRAQQTDIAAWFSLVAMMAELKYRNKPAIPKNDRVYLMQKKVPPPKWRIWIGYYLGGNKRGASINHYGLNVHDRKRPKVSCETECNTQTTTALLGRLALHCYSQQSSDPFPYNIDKAKFLKVAPLWPITTDKLNWQKAGSMNAMDGEWLIHSLPGIENALRTRG